MKPTGHSQQSKPTSTVHLRMRQRCSAVLGKCGGRTGPEQDGAQAATQEACLFRRLSTGRCEADQSKPAALPRTPAALDRACALWQPGYRYRYRYSDNGIWISIESNQRACTHACYRYLGICDGNNLYYSRLPATVKPYDPPTRTTASSHPGGSRRSRCRAPRRGTGPEVHCG